MLLSLCYLSELLVPLLVQENLIGLVFDLHGCHLCGSLVLILSIDDVVLVTRESGWLLQQGSHSECRNDIGVLKVCLAQLILLKHLLCRLTSVVGSIVTATKTILIINSRLEDAGVILGLTAATCPLVL